MDNGRPLKYTQQQLQKMIDDYFDSCFEEVYEPVKDSENNIAWIPVYDRHGNIMKAQTKPFSITGLALACDTTRETLCEYERKPGFVDTIKKAKEKVANYAEEQCLTARNPAGAIFIAKNHGFRDKTEIEHSGDIGIADRIQRARDRVKNGE